MGSNLSLGENPVVEIVVGYAGGYDRETMRPFCRSLKNTGFQGKVILFADGGGAEEAERHGFDVRPCPPLRMKIHSDRFLSIAEVLPENKAGVVCLDTRDVIFQTNPKYLPSDYIHVFEEDGGQTIGSCPYNSSWIKLGYGDDEFKALRNRPILCVGSICGESAMVKNYLTLMVKELKRIQPNTGEPQDQAVHNHLCHAFQNTPLGPRQWKNEESPIYTVGYIRPRETVEIKGDLILNRAGNVPAVIHQWDRHQNLSALVRRLYLD